MSHTLKLTTTLVLFVFIATALKAQQATDVGLHEFFHLNDNNNIQEIQEFIVPKEGWYDIEAWGGKGGGSYYSQSTPQVSPGGDMGAVACRVYLHATDKLYFVIGGKGETPTLNTTNSSPVANIPIAGGFPSKFSISPFNRGAGGVAYTNAISSGGGGSATSVYLNSYTSWSNAIMIAGGGGGDSKNTQIGGSGGIFGTQKTNVQGGVVYSSTSGQPTVECGAGGTDIGGVAGTQTTGGKPSFSPTNGQNYNSSNPGCGGSGSSGGNNGAAAGGGGGGYAGGGGGAGANSVQSGSGGGGGGSSFIANLTNGENVLHTAASHYPVNYPLNSNGSSNDGNGYVRIGTLVSEAVDDKVIMRPNTSLDITVLDNDLYTGNVSISIISEPGHGTAVVSEYGTVEYTPNENWEGIDVFEYKIHNAISNTDDQAKVYILVIGAISCEDEITIDLDMPAGASYTWYDAENEGNMLAENAAITIRRDEAIDYRVNRWLSVNYAPNGIDQIFPDIIHVPGGFGPLVMYWNGAGENSDWNNPSNWEDENGTSFDTWGLVPWPCTNVYIPGDVEIYPSLEYPTTTRDIYNGCKGNEPACDSIHIYFGGEVAKTCYLNYNFAMIDLTLNPNRWYMLSPVLEHQYSGDYLEDGSKYRIDPEILMMYYQTGNPQIGTAKVESKFTGYFNNLDELLPPCSGHAIWVDEGERTDESDFTIHFPKDSIQYSYYSIENNAVIRETRIMARDKRGRFIYEGNTTFHTRGDGSFLQTIENSNDFPTVIIGNPYMSHFDIVEFQNKNDDFLKKSFYIWNEEDGMSYETFLHDEAENFTITTGGVSPTIAPMQSFIIGTKDMFTNALLFTPDMSTILPGNTLKSASTKTMSDVLKIEVLREGIRQNGIALRHKEGASRHYDERKDVWTMIPQSMGSYVSLYSLVDEGAAAIYTTGDVTTPIELGIAVGNTIKKSVSQGKIETYTIRIAPGSEDAWSDMDIYLLDSQENNTMYNLSESAYDFQNTTGDITGRFCLFAQTNSSNVKNITSEKDIVLINYAEGQMKIISPSDNNSIQNISVFDIVGRPIYKALNLNVPNYSFNLSDEQAMVIVKVQTEKGIKTKKILLK